MRRILFISSQAKRRAGATPQINSSWQRNCAQGLNPTQREDREVLTMAKKLLHHRLLSLGLAKLSPSYLQREPCFSRCGARRERKGENVFRHPLPARGRCAAKRSLPQALLARFRCKKMRLQGEADFCQGHFAKFW